ncbi:multicopper oxidase domain-containing protein [Nostocoides sp. F2B08]|uniref:multicopper oxidase domain-containing protein n=1 Tax=Nostocoides sp. F2B08 TaxID=2653936 RepID=UPI001262F7B2|nr:multicopper oxidase domain-containing protein [Tetrasphaera sp. F2B08]KAB7744199.1 multicopper oxidase domain-containing protein [Tetrasphaera sp. F2B08]
MTITSSPTPRSATAPEVPQRGGSSALRDRVPVLWLAVALIFALLHPWFPGLGWVAIHLLLLGALSHSILVWSAHFTRALLKTRLTQAAQRRQSQRIVIHIVGTLLVVGGVSFGTVTATAVGATCVAAAVIWHGVELWQQLRVALPGRFRVTVRYYLASAACLPVGAGLGVLLATGPGEELHGRLIVAHSLTMVLGWVGLTVIGTLLTLWATMLRTRLDERADLLARQALPLILAGLAVVVASAALGLRWGAVAGLVGYLAGVLWWGRALLLPTRTAPPRHMSSWSVAAALVWFAVALVLIALRLVREPSWAAVADAYTPITIAVTAGFAAQLLIGALSHLIPVIIGGGARVWRTGQAVFNRYAVARLTIANLGLVLWLAPTPPAVRTTAAGMTLLALGSFLPILVLATRAAVRAKRARRDDNDGPRPPVTPERGIWSTGQFVAGLAVVAVALSAAVAWDPAAAGFTSTAAAAAGRGEVRPTGNTTTVEVSMEGMRFTPERISVPVGDRLLIELVNSDPTTTHDLVLANGADSGRLMPGERMTLDVGIIGGDLDGWCSIVGHRQMGMTLLVAAEGAQSAEHSDHAASSAPVPPVSAVADDTVPADFRAVDAGLPPLGSTTTHELTLTVEDTELEVAPGVRQTRWTFNGEVPGPTLHGRVGDTFVITLVNDASMGHSIDFHAGALAPDRPMRTIPPGQSLTYTFTAQRAGIWMYHCATMPMSAHIAAGLHGAVVIEPPGLPPVEASYVFQQSGAYVLGDGRTSIEEVDAAAALTGAPSFFTFNGVAFQYDHRPIEVEVGERVRAWLLNAGPTGSMSFHVIGSQFETTYAEGGYLLKDGADAFGSHSAGSQALALQPGQGGFVEMTLPEAGTYPFVTHDMPLAESGAHGLFRAVSTP